MVKKRKVIVIAGTAVDTEMGVSFLLSKKDESLEVTGVPAADSCDEQVKFQYSSDEEKRTHMDEIFDAAIADGVRDFFIYCNSLSGAFDFDSYETDKNAELKAKKAESAIEIEEQQAGNTELNKNTSSEDEIKEIPGRECSNIHIYTPLQIYRELGSKYSRVGVMAANNLSTHAIEAALMSTNPDVYVIGTGNMSIVRAIEEGRPPRDIVRDLGLAAMLDYMQASGAEAVILGCTHFPYLKDELSGLTNLPLIDPADLMFRNLLQIA